MSDLRPLAVYDARESSWPPANLDGFLWWLREHGIEPNDTYRIEVYLLDCLFARVFQYDRDEHDRRYCGVDHDHLADPDECEVAHRKPFDVPIPDVPPVESGRGAA